MAIVNAVNYQLSQNVPVDNVLSKENFGRVRVMHDVYEAVTLPDGDFINVGKIPAGAKILAAKLVFDALGVSSTLALGDNGIDGGSADADRLITAGDTSAAGVLELDENQIDSGWGFVYSKETLLRINSVGAIASGTIKVWILYTVD